MTAVSELIAAKAGYASNAVAWLPARVQPLQGEAFTSFCRRLADANGASTAELLRLCRQRHPGAKTPIAAVAASIGMHPAKLDMVTLDSIGKAVRRTHTGWQLKTSVWQCQRCSTGGIEDTLRGSAIQFLCLRCNSFLSCADDLLAEPQPADDELNRVQREILDAMASKDNEPIGQRLIRLRRCATSMGMHLLHTEFGALDAVGGEPTELLARVDDRWKNSALGLPEIPTLVGETMRAAWGISASTHASYLAVSGLGDSPLSDHRRWTPYTGYPRPRIRAYTQASDRRPTSIMASGTRIRQLVIEGHLQPEHVPIEVRYATDPLLLDEDVWSWRRHVCAQLRRWIINLTIADDIRVSYRRGEPISYAVRKRQRELEAPDEWVFPDVTASGAAQVLSEMVQLAENLAVLTPAETADPRVQLSGSTLWDLAPNAALYASADVDVARHWIWLDEVVGQDAFGYLPECPPSVIASFDRALRPEERLALRQYRCEQNTLMEAEAAPIHRPQNLDRWPPHSA
ncbi:hypothetical protein [Mycolicibacterium alvei]|uniref:Uncharacterized protein n=1 Tax=Mycolicibacterium alvei TaxID=67081 RepID=A0A6N4UTP8_9MYCO|nr:hypothetical protein [Mycolicibacterium alvei]MCV7001530.1 hypothetical protein [Mycolicibacterium alvei]BBX28436.1 hypothetical protein MALV_35610 [Mycolicibacterium alvei]